jgi:hypothetical protein
MPDLAAKLLLTPEEVAQLADKARAERRLRKVGGARRWASTTLTRLRDRRWDVLYPANLRLFLYLTIQSWNGRYEVSLTNEMAAEIGISDRGNKARHLKQLRDLGLITVIRRGHLSVTVVVHPAAIE